MKKSLFLLLSPFALLVAVDTATVTEAKAEVHSSSGSKVKGTVTFTQVDGGVKVVADFDYSYLNSYWLINF